jgi:hypothetical protein
MSQGICYCRQCQKSGGLYGSALMVLPRNALDCAQEALSFHTTKSNRGSTVQRYFCSGCGTSIFSQISDVTDICTVKVATLDDVSFFKPEYLVWTRSASPLCIFPIDVPKFVEGAPIEMLLKY